MMRELSQRDEHGDVFELRFREVNMEERVKLCSQLVLGLLGDRVAVDKDREYDCVREVIDELEAYVGG